MRFADTSYFLARLNPRDQWHERAQALGRDRTSKGFDHYRRRPDKEWSLTDGISFLVMQEHGVTEALTADHHFVQAGFQVLLQN